ncbi:hypothetical protein J3E69DRAFT_228617 [Trichoderma sp. SZMC 28015]
MVLTGPPLHQEWAPSSNQAFAGQSHNYRPRQQILCTRYRSRDTKNVHLPSISSSTSPRPCSYTIQLGLVSSSMGARGAENRVGKMSREDGFSSRQGQMPQLGQGAEVSRSASMAARFRMLRKGDVRGLSPKARVVKDITRR